MHDPLGLSIGTTTLVAVRNGSAPVTRRAILTLFPHRAPEIGVPAENPNLTEPGTPINGFVKHMGESVALVATDGSTYEPGLLVVEALDAMVTAAGADAASSEITIAVPAYWQHDAVAALRDALRTHAGFTGNGMGPRLVPDNVAALTAVNAGPGLPPSGMVGLLDFGGGGTTLTLADAGSGFEPITPAVRYPEFSGEQIDQALRAHIAQNLGHTGNGDPEATTAIGQFAQLREECRQVKEFLSTQTIAEVAVELPGCRRSVQVTRAELENLIRDALSGAISAFEELLARNNIDWNDLAAVTAVGGGASIPVVTQCLSARTRVPVVTAPQPALAMALGATMLRPRRVSSDFEVDAPTRAAMAAVASAEGTTAILGLPTDDMTADERSSTLRKLAWSEVEDTGDEPVPYIGEAYDEPGPGAPPTRYGPQAEPPEEPPRPRFRLAWLLVGLAAVVAMLAVGGVAYTMTSTTERKAPPAPSTPVPPPASRPQPLSPSPPPPPSAEPSPSIQPPPGSPEPSPPASVPPAATTYEPPATTTDEPPVSTPTTTVPPSTTTTTTTTVPPSTTTTTPQPTTTSTTAPSSPSVTTTATTTVPMATTYLTVPLVPFPIPVQVPQGQANPNQP
ncbi:Hsp70 family protein [Mycobacterium sp. SM1]|uniref:Hsp70 family protein n=1 Tax=Mycobacterium sp. SM1 TaxID=2816243 RepID=UPI001BD0FC1F|nr:Hsp70 family protein [Mycobacterium sp. SM1]MBS4728372.1 Hsp70 family protein [Mycobacterium sp. SM1]